MQMALDSYLKELDKTQRTNVMLTLMQYPRTATLIERDTPVVTAYYSCKSNQCAFDQVVIQIKENVDLKAYGATEVALTMIEEIKQHPDDFLPHKLDGYQLYRAGFDLLQLHRKDGKTPATSGRMGFIEYNNLRAQAMEASSRQRKEALEMAAVRIADSIGNKNHSCMIM